MRSPRRRPLSLAAPYALVTTMPGKIAKLELPAQRRRGENNCHAHRLNDLVRAVGRDELEFRSNGENLSYYANRRAGSHRQRERVARSAVDVADFLLARNFQPDHSEIGVVAQIGDDHFVDFGAQFRDEACHQIVSHRTRRDDPMQRKRDGLRFHHADPDRQYAARYRLAQDDDRRPCSAVEADGGQLDRDSLTAGAGLCEGAGDGRAENHAARGAPGYCLSKIATLWNF